jgi:tryptophan 5-monooxygenase
LQKCYFFTIEFGLCKQNGELKVYGAGLLSSIAELKHAVSDAAEKKPFDPNIACAQECRITTFQDSYFISESFKEAKEQIRLDDAAEFNCIEFVTLFDNILIGLNIQFKGFCIKY